MESETWQEMIDVNLTGVWKTIRATVPYMIEADNGGAVILISSTAAIVAIPGASHYSAAKTGVLGLSRALAQELAPHFIRVNTVHSTAVNTDMIHNEPTYKLFARGKAHATRGEVESAFTQLNAIPVPWVEPRDISNAVLFLASEEARYVTGCMLTVDCGSTIKYPGT
jgi:NAD(P)-dependent dehydrogenase (short-subunit alcohol dehydrogenase family)